MPLNCITYIHSCQVVRYCKNQLLLVAQIFDESLNTMNMDQIAKPLLDVVKIFLFSFMSYGIIDLAY